MSYQEVQLEEGVAAAATVAPSTMMTQGPDAQNEARFASFPLKIAPLAFASAALLAVGGYGLSHFVGGQFLQTARTDSSTALASQDALDGMNAASKQSVAKNTRRRPTVKPYEHLHDGNTCEDSEELYAGLCYTKCSVLMGLSAAHRVSAFTCCPTPDCHGNLLKMKTASLLPCQGFDVSSADAGKACPHEQGACLKDEEQFLGECYEKCETLTEGKFPKRIAAATCCNPDAEGGCLNISNDRTMPRLNVGGGQGDADASTPAGPHFPLKRLTEAAA
eukprot:TRINITY_DN39_c0_g1_i1.p1 TRINITY_DN39_c0_g1~~TRINITY_DN39_c0_g1_i1.p1  ORF type:complete len:277 (+),score=55.79 TRINITY_DN39_c0_g1_i1:85-915(+)